MRIASLRDLVGRSLLTLVVASACAGDDGIDASATDPSPGATSSVSATEATTGANTSFGTSTTGSATEGTSEATSDATSTTDPTGATSRTTGVTVGETDPVTTSETSAGTETGGLGGCCEPGLGPECDDPDVAACVCAQDEFCCTEQWDGQCVQEVETFGCGVCGGMTLGCCDAHASPSCDDAGVAECVCAEDSYCCEESWDEQCVNEVEIFGCGVCGGGDEPCCLPHGTPGCEDDAVEACVCAENPYCCEEMWDEACTAAVTELGCGICEESGPCCEAHGGLGCADAEIEACVCDVAPGCCEEGWDEICAGLVEFLECGICEPPPPPDECCAAHDAPGCAEPDVEACVCAGAPECCEGPWTDACVEAVELLGCGSCGGGGDACCEVHPDPMCEDAEVTACVCAEDSFCCETEWDQACVDGVELYGCGVCGGGGDSCCEAHALPGCADDAVEACVCAQDEFCCNQGWDDLCVQEVTMFGCGVCE